MTRPGPGGPWQQSPQHQGAPAHGQWQQQQPPGQWQYPQGQYPPTGGQWVPPPPKRGKGGKVTLLVILIVVVLAVGAWGTIFLINESESSANPPPPDTSEDLDQAPLGCGLFTEAEIAPYIPGTMKMEPTGFGSDSEIEKSGQCMYKNPEFIDEGVPAAHISVTTYVYGATQRESGVDRATDTIRRKAGSPLGIAHAHGDVYREIDGSGGDVAAAELSIRYYNIVVTIHYSHNEIGPKGFASAMQTLGTSALQKIVPPEQGNSW